MTSTLHQYYQRTSTYYYPPTQVFFASCLSEMTQFFPNLEILTPKLKSPLKPGKPTQIVATKVSNLLEKGRSCCFGTTPDAPNSQGSICHVEAVEALLEELKKRMPNRLHIYRHNGESVEEQVWNPKYGSAVCDKLKIMRVKRTSQQAFVIVSKVKLDVLEPWYVNSTVVKKKRGNKNKNKGKPGAKKEENSDQNLENTGNLETSVESVKIDSPQIETSNQ